MIVQIYSLFGYVDPLCFLPYRVLQIAPLPQSVPQFMSRCIPATGLYELGKLTQIMGLADCGWEQGWYRFERLVKTKLLLSTNYIQTHR
jgi:hypothetical protein